MMSFSWTCLRPLTRSVTLRLSPNLKDIISVDICSIGFLLIYIIVDSALLLSVQRLLKNQCLLFGCTFQCFSVRFLLEFLRPGRHWFCHGHFDNTNISYGTSNPKTCWCHETHRTQGTESLQEVYL
jgi:hypothetical protein